MNLTLPFRIYNIFGKYDPIFCGEIYISGVALSKILCTRQPDARMHIHCDDVRLSHAILGKDVRWKYDLNLST